MYKQHRTTGTIDWGAYCGEEIAIAMLGGGVAGGVGFLMGAWASAAFGGGLRGSFIAGALEGSLTDGAMQITINWASGRTWHHNLGWTLLGGGLAGSTGSGIRWWRRSMLPYDAELVVATNLKTSVPFGHNLVGIRRANQQKTDMFEQVMNVRPHPTFFQSLRGGQDTFVVKTKSRRGYSMHRIPVTADQAEAAWQTAVTLANQPSTGPYHILTNSCTSYCRTVLAAGGLQPPRWVVTPHTLATWSVVQSWIRN